MSENIYLLQAVVLVLTGAVCVLAIQLLRRVALCSLSAPLLLIFSSIIGFGSVYYYYRVDDIYELKRESMRIPPSETAFVSMYYSSIILISVALAVLLFILKTASLPAPWKSIILNREHRVVKCDFFSPSWIVCCGAVLIGFMMFMLSARTFYAFKNLQLILESQNYSVVYYAVRQEMIFLAPPFWQATLITLFWILVPLVCLLSLDLWRRHFRPEFKPIFLITLGMWFVANVLRLQKGPLVGIVIAICIVLLIPLLRGRRMKLAKIMARGLVSIAAFLALAYMVYSFVGFDGNLLVELMDRAFVTPIHVSYAHFLVFPKYSDFLYFNGSNFLNFILAFGRDTQAQMAHFFIVAELMTGLLFTMNTGILGTGWAEYGYWGVFQCSLIIFGVMAAWDRVILSSLKMSVFSVVLVGYFVGGGANLVESDLVGVLKEYGVILAPIALWLLLLPCSLEVNRTNSSQVRSASN